MFEVVFYGDYTVLVDAHDYEFDEDDDLVFWDEMEDGEWVECGRFRGTDVVGVHTVEVEETEADE